MASLIPESSKTDFISALNDHFDTFKEDITIFKEPKKVITNQSQSIYAGYGAQKEIVEYETVSQSFSALVNFRDRQDEEFIDDIKIKDVRGDIRIKVEQDCRDYIKNNGKTEAVIVQGKNYNVITDDGTREFLGQKYFVFHLESTS